MKQIMRAAVRAGLDYLVDRYAPGLGRVRPPASPYRPQLLYRLYDRRGALLYVGVSSRGPVRLAEHYRDKAWFPDVSHARFEWFATRAEVLAAEKSAIIRELPRYNVVHAVGL